MSKTWGDKLILFLATGFGLGRSPVAPGTFGTLSGLPLIWVIGLLDPMYSSFFIVCFILGAVWIADRAETIMGVKDPGAIVIDEMAGYLVTMSLVPADGFVFMAAGFAAFRCFDIFKPPPVRYFEKRFTGGAGVVLDDVMAGVMAAILLKAIQVSGVIAPLS